MDVDEPIAAAEITPPLFDPPRRALLLVFFTIFLDILGFGILVPVIPFLVQPFDSSALIIGLLTVSFSISQFIAAPILGVMSDRWGRRPVLLISILGAALAYAAFGAATALWVFFAARIVDGLTGGNISTAQAYIADVSKPEDRAKNFGLIGAAFGAGFVLGPAIGGIMSHISLAAPAYLAGALCLLSAIFGYFFLPESLPQSRRRTRPFTLRDFNPFSQLLDFIKNPVLAMNFTSLLMMGLAMNALRSNFAVYARESLHYDASHVGYLYTYLGVIVVFTQMVLVRRIAPKFGDRKTALIGFTAMMIGFLWMATEPDLFQIICIMPLIAVGNGLCFPTITAMSSHAVQDDQQGGVMGAQQSVNSMAMIIGPFVAGWAFDHISMGAPYAIAAGFLLIGLLLSLRHLRKISAA
ncbi:MAG TPA: MFS transporter [Alphaproteobacteria bacterium]|nr:tetracycline resistance MFS efflux pump [Rhodospirillaceae bacterium]HRJ11902.1 MFS transporter [Alphaproteobacteria bacterium]